MVVYKNAGYKKYSKIRADGLYVPSGENDNLIVQKLTKNTASFGIFGYSFLRENEDKVQGMLIDGVEVSPENISSGKYPLSRSLFFYIKKDHEKDIPAISKYVKLFMSEKMIGDDSELSDIGLISLPKEQRAAMQKSVSKRKELTLADLSKK